MSAFDPSPAPILFYDGECGLCHRAVLFALARDPGGERFRFAALGGDAFRRAIPESERARLPDSLVLLAADGTIHTRSSAVVRLLRRVGGIWGALGALLRAVPTPLRDRAYDFVARIRHRLFARPEEACPVVPPELRSRFL